MRFRADHEFAATPQAVADVLCDPAFHATLDLSDLSRPEIVEHSESGSRRLLRLRYEFVGHLDPIAKRLLAGRRLTWIQELQLDRDTGLGTLRFSAESEADRLYGSADVKLVEIEPGPVDGARTRREVAGELFVKVPLVGGTAERRIVPGLVARLDVEADALSVALRAS
jgi:hypothetical protein